MPGHDDAAGRLGLLQGTLDLILLQTLRAGPQHGYAISSAIIVGSRETFQVDTGSLYPALHRLERRRWIKSEWRTSDNNQRAKYYQLTPAGRKQLALERSRWERVVQAMRGILDPANGTAGA